MNRKIVLLLWVLGIFLMMSIVYIINISRSDHKLEKQYVCETSIGKETYRIWIPPQYNDNYKLYAAEKMYERYQYTPGIDHLDCTFEYINK
jgi:hypothetical protein